MKLEDINKPKENYRDELYKLHKAYTIGTNDGSEYRQAIFTGTKLYHGKPMMTFKTSYDEQQITINPSFHSYTIQETIIETTEPKSEKKEKDNG